MPELRKDPITGRWVIISTERGKRPNDFLREPVVARGFAGMSKTIDAIAISPDHEESFKEGLTVHS